MTHALTSSMSESSAAPVMRISGPGDSLLGINAGPGSSFE